MRIKKIDFTIKPEAFAGRQGKSERRRAGRVVHRRSSVRPAWPPTWPSMRWARHSSRSEVVRLQYHLHVPGPDPLTNPDSEARAEFYARFVRSTPTSAR